MNDITRILEGKLIKTGATTPLSFFSLWAGSHLKAPLLRLSLEEKKPAPTLGKELFFQQDAAIHQGST
ncbi:MAG: hypothetical protein Q8P67_19080 [archaeon]|nr:hypothetical protein [archaeon]